MTRLVRWLLDILTDLLIYLERRAIQGNKQPITTAQPKRVKAKRSRTRVRYSSYDL